MCKYIGKDIYDETIEYTFLALNSNNIRVGLVGGGKAANIKVKTLLKKGCYIEVLSKNINKELLDISSKNLKLLEGEYNIDFINDKHLVIIAIDDYETVARIIRNCEENFKIYINSSKFKDGLAVLPAQRNTNETAIAVTTFSGNPKGAVMVAEAAKRCISDYDEFLNFSGTIRNNAKNLSKYKKEIINFVVTEDFRQIWEKRKDKLMLNLFFDKEIVETLYKL